MNNIAPENERALWILKNKGEKTLKDLAKELGVTTEGARFQLLKLSNDGFVKSESRAIGRGRPQQFWTLTEKGHARFPDTHAELTIRLISKIREQLGEETLEQIIKANGEDNLDHYLKEISKNDSLEVKVNKLAELRSNEGYMATVENDGRGGLLLIENHCPICAAAKECQGFCATELQVFRSVLGSGTKVERVDHILSGARRCAYLIKDND